jgi:hypothetical protein
VQLLEDDAGLLLMKDDIVSILTFGLGVFVVVVSLIMGMATGFELVKFFYGSL